jgi:predicted dinucleotide-binding enzyme
MNIGIIGVGQLGGTLARKLTALGHQVRVANSRGPASLEALAKETGARAVTVEDTVRDVELVILSIPEKGVLALPKRLFDSVPNEVIVADTGNYYPEWRDDRIDAIERGTTDSGWVASALGRPVVKVFNNIMAHNFAESARPKGAKDRIALPVAGDDTRAKSIMIALLDELGFDGVDAGSLDESWRQQPGTPVYCTDLSSEGVRRALAKADRARAPEMRGVYVTKYFQQVTEGATLRQLVQMARELTGATAL